MNKSHTHILLVDDDEANLELVRDMLQPEGCTIVPARDGVEALAKYDQYQPDLVLLDLMLPRLNGYEVCAHLRNHAGSRAVPIIMMTGLQEGEVKARAMETGVDDFLLKPVNHRELVDRIRARLVSIQPDRSGDNHQQFQSELHARIEHLQRTLHLMAHCSVVRSDIQLSELLTEALETANQLGEVLE
jgi:DNA-binding response OmpR family regulator